MLLPIRTLCGKRERKDGTRPIFIQYCYTSQRRTLLNADITIPGKYWNRRFRRVSNDLPKEFGDSSVLNEELHRLLRLAEDIISFALNKHIADPLLFVKQIFHPRFDLSTLHGDLREITPTEKIDLDFFNQYDHYVKSKTKKVTPGMLKVYNNIKVVLQDFEKHRKRKITFHDIDFNFYEELTDYLLFEHIQRRRRELVKGLKLSSAGKVIKQLRIFLRNRIRRKIIQPINLEDFKILDEEADAIYLTEQDITGIYKVDLEKTPHLEKYRNLLVFGCLTGLRFSDFSAIKPGDVRDM